MSLEVGTPFTFVGPRGKVYTEVLDTHRNDGVDDGFGPRDTSKHFILFEVIPSWPSIPIWGEVVRQLDQDRFEIKTVYGTSEGVIFRPLHPGD